MGNRLSRKGGNRNVDSYIMVGKAITRQPFSMFWAWPPPPIHYQIRAFRLGRRPTSGKIFMDAIFSIPDLSSPMNTPMPGLTFVEYKIDLCAKCGATISRTAGGQ